MSTKVFNKSEDEPVLEEKKVQRKFTRKKRKPGHYEFRLMHDLPELSDLSISELKNIFICIGIHEGLLPEETKDNKENAKDELIHSIWQGFHDRELSDPAPPKRNKKDAPLAYPYTIDDVQSYYLDNDAIVYRAARLCMPIGGNREEVFDAIKNRNASDENMQVFNLPYLRSLVKYNGVTSYSSNKQDKANGLAQKSKIISFVRNFKCDPELLSNDALSNRLRTHHHLINFTNPVYKSFDTAGLREVSNAVANGTEDKLTGKLKKLLPIYKEGQTEKERIKSMTNKNRYIELYNNRNSSDPFWIYTYYTVEGLKKRCKKMGIETCDSDGKSFSKEELATALGKKLVNFNISDYEPQGLRTSAVLSKDFVKYVKGDNDASESAEVSEQSEEEEEVENFVKPKRKAGSSKRSKK